MAAWQAARAFSDDGPHRRVWFGVTCQQKLNVARTIRTAATARLSALAPVDCQLRIDHVVMLTAMSIAVSGG